MPPPYTIPPRLRRGYELLVGWTDEDIQRLLSALDEGLPGAFPPAVSRRIAKALPDREQEAREILDTVFTAEGLRVVEGIDPSTAAEGLSAADGLELKDEQRAKLRSRLVRFLEHKTLRLSVIANERSNADERSLVEAQAVVDVRAVFDAHDAGDDEQLTPAGALILYVLSLTYHKERGDETLVMTLDASDLQSLQEELRRVAREGVAIKSFLESAGLRRFPVDGEDE